MLTNHSWIGVFSRCAVVLTTMSSGCGDHRAAAVAIDASAEGEPLDARVGDAGASDTADAAISDALDVPPDASPDAPVAVAVNVRLADTVTDAPGATGTGVGDPTHAVNGVRGTGTSSGSLDVFALGYTPQNDHITLSWSHGQLQNGSGADLAVFENPFLSGGGTFMDLIVVEVSIDGVEFRPLAHDYVATDPAVYANNPALWQGFGGRTPVLLNADTNLVDPFDPAVAGGDLFDLDSVVGDDAVARAIRANGARFVRLVSAPARIDPHTGVDYVHAVISNGADIDGMYGRYVVAE